MLGIQLYSDIVRLFLMTIFCTAKSFIFFIYCKPANQALEFWNIPTKYVFCGIIHICVKIVIFLELKLKY